MSIFLYFVPGIIAAGGVLAYDYFKRVGVAKALQIMSIILYIIGGMIMLPQISGAYQDFMRIMSRADEGAGASGKSGGGRAERTPLTFRFLYKKEFKVKVVFVRRFRCPQSQPFLHFSSCLCFPAFSE